ncbi:MAG: cobalamin-dependent protein, partial [Clostridia bacterium]|nr:cobalamin-dependent protein [Clostridia bacterium]
MKNNIMLLAFYNKKALGVRYLETALKAGGYGVRAVFYKDFNSVRPTKTTPKELALLKEDILKQKPLFVGLSVMSSMYLETVDSIIEMIKADLDVPVVCGGAFATMFPEYFLKRGVDYVIRSDGEIAMRRLADALRDGKDPSQIPSLCFMREGEAVINEIADLTNEIDAY